MRNRQKRWSLVWKAPVWDERISFALVAFTTDIDDRQVEILDFTDIRRSSVVNASDTATIEGLELDLRIAVTEELTLSGFYAYLDVDEDVMVSGVSEPVNFVRAPEHSGTVAVDYHLGEIETGQVKLHVEYTGISNYLFNSTSTVEGSARCV